MKNISMDKEGWGYFDQIAGGTGRCFSRPTGVDLCGVLPFSEPRLGPKSLSAMAISCRVKGQSLRCLMATSARVREDGRMTMFWNRRAARAALICRSVYPSDISATVLTSVHACWELILQKYNPVSDG